MIYERKTKEVNPLAEPKIFKSLGQWNEVETFGTFITTVGAMLF